MTQDANERPAETEKTLSYEGLTDEQRAGVDLALSSRVACITGGAGSGKTTALAALCEHPTARERGVLLLAPTGKAAARISEKTRRPASTIHRALGWEPRLRKVRYDAVTPWPQRQIVCDEASMVDVLLCADLIDAAAEGAHVTFVGDVNQLPPVGPGAPFADLLRSGVVPTARLATIHRQGEGSPVVTAAHAILAGSRPRDVKGSSEAFLFVPVPTDLDVMARALSVVQRSIPAKYGLATDAEIQVLSGTVLLSDELNGALARHFNAGAGPYLGAGDKVLHTKNNYELGVFNGDVGRCLLRDERGAQVEYDGRIVAYPAGVVRRELVRAWSLTVHRAQGSEYPAVVVCLDGRAAPLLTRQWLYTAVTRARRVCVVIGTERAYRRAFSTPAPVRQSALADLLRVNSP